MIEGLRKINYRSFYFWFFAIVVVYTFYDYIEHILRPNSDFARHPFMWLLFTLASISALFIITFGLTKLMERLWQRKHLIFEISSFAIWVVLHVTVLGPLFNSVLWPYSTLFFQFEFSAFFVLVAFYVLLRIGFYLALQRKTHNS